VADESKKSFPVIPVKHWWALRDRFRKSIPSKVDAQYVASVLNMTPVSAQNNILPSLRAFGIIDDDSKPTDLAVKWRDDQHYPKVCEKIRKDVYPQELLDAASSVSDREITLRWFANHSGKGESLVNKMTAVYLMLCEADPTQAAASPTPSTSSATKKPTPKPAKKTTKKPAAKSDGEEEGREVVVHKNLGPALHFNVQVHISTDATAEQIDQIFASMGKHLKQLSS
jgi:hypothetical protein